MIDLDAYARPAADPATLAARREALLDQMGWIEDEATALGPLLGALPPWAVEKAPLPTDLSVRDTLAALARLDRELAVWFDDGAPADLTLALADAPATDATLDALLEDVAAARRDLRALASALDPAAWSRTVTVNGDATDVYGAVLRIVQHDADRLKEIAYRLHEADVTMRPPAA